MERMKTESYDSALRALSSLRGLRGSPEVPPLCRETQSLGQQMLNAPLGINGLTFTQSHLFYVIKYYIVFIVIYNYNNLVLYII